MDIRANIQEQNVATISVSAFDLHLRRTRRNKEGVG